nr:flagellar export chaperone FliS [Sedimentibacter sp.]
MFNPYDQYKKTSINTMTKGELLLLLFDEIIKKLNYGKILMEKGDYEEANKNLHKCRQIFNHLIVTIDKNFALSGEIVDIYSFLNGEIIKASAKKSTKHIEDILPIIRNLRSTWEEADKIARASKN